MAWLDEDQGDEDQGGPVVPAELALTPGSAEFVGRWVPASDAPDGFRASWTRAERADPMACAAEAMDLHQGVVRP